MAIDVFDTVSLVRANRRRDKRLLEEDSQLHQRDAEVNAALLKARQTLHDEALVPLRDVFQRLQRIEMVEATAIERPTDGGGGEVDIEPRWRRFVVPVVVVGAAVAGGTIFVMGPPALGRTVVAGVNRVGEKFGSASTGKAIKTLHGAAKSSATRAWIGRRAGGSGMADGDEALSRMYTASADFARRTIMTVQVQALGSIQQEKARDLDRRAVRTKARQDAAPALHARSEHMQHLVQEVRTELADRIPAFTALVEACDDITLYDARQRAEVAKMVELDGLAVMVMTCPITDTDGRMTEESGQVAAEADARLKAMRSEA